MTDYSTAKERLLGPNGHRDAFGFVQHRSWDNGQPGDFCGKGDSVLRTSIAAIAFALEGDSINAADLVSTIDAHAWSNNGHPVRHPEVHDFHKDGRDLGLSPMSKDQFLAFMVACDRLYRCSSATTAHKATARDALIRFTDYLLIHNFRLQSQYTDDQITNDIDTTNPKGPETYILLSTDIYALRAIALSMDIPAATWTAWGTVAVSPWLQVAADYVAFVMGKLLRFLLDRIAFRTTYQCSLPVEVFGSLNVVSGTIEIAIPDNVCDEIQAGFETLIRELVRAGNHVALEPIELIEKTLRGHGTRLSGNLGQRDWALLIIQIFGKVYPWLNGDVLRTVAGQTAAIEIGRTAFESENPDRFYTVQMAFWPLWATLKSQREIWFLLQPVVDSFCSGISRHQNGLWGWLNDDDAMVDRHLLAFEADSYDNVAHLWESSWHSTKKALTSPRKVDSARVDFLLLKQLKDGTDQPCVPALDFSGISAALEEWGQTLVQRIIDSIRDSYERTGRWVVSEIDDLGNGIRQTWDKSQGFVRSTYVRGKRVAKEVFIEGELALKDIWEHVNGQTKRVQSAIKNNIEGIRRTWINGTRTLVQKFEGGSEVVRQVYQDGVLVTRDIMRDGKRVQRVFKDGVVVITHNWVNGRMVDSVSNTVDAVNGGIKRTIKHMFGSPEKRRETYINDQLATIDEWMGDDHIQIEYISGREEMRRTWRQGVLKEQLVTLASGEYVVSSFEDGFESRRRHYNSAGKEVLRHSWEADRYTQTVYEETREVTYTWTNRILHRKDYRFALGHVRVNLVGGLEIERVTTDTAGNRARETWDAGRNYLIRVTDSAGNPFVGDPSTLSEFFAFRFGQNV